MNKHVPQSSIAGDNVKSPEETASFRQGGETGAKTAEAKSPRQPADNPQAEKPQADKPQSDKPQSDKPQRGEADAGVKSTPESSPAETNPFRRAFWTRSGLTLAVILGAIIVGVMLSWSGGGSKNVYVFVKASYSTVTVSARATGTLAAHDYTDVVPKVGGRAESVLAKSGDRVVMRQILARLESRAARDELLRAQTQVAATQARVAQAEADVAETRAAALRAKNEAKPGAYENAQAGVARAVARAAELQALSGEAQAQLTEARAQIESLEVRAPIDGIVLKSDIEPGQYVSAAGGRALFTLASDLSLLKLVADIPESQLGAAHVGEQAQFTVPAFPRRIFPATLTALDLLPKKETKDGKEVIAYPATLSGRNADGALRPGMSANVELIIASVRNVLVVPNQALNFSPPRDIEAKYPKPKISAGGPRIGRVWLLNGDNPEPRDVMLGLTDGRVTQIASGPLRTGEKVITSLIH